MTPIINPWIFYLLSVADKFQIVNIFSLVILGFVLFIGFICFREELDSVYNTKDENEKIIQNYKKKVKYPLIIFIINLFLLLFVPGKETLTKMIIANVVTYENVDAGVDTTKEIIDYVFEKIDNLNAEDE